MENPRAGRGTPAGKPGWGRGSATGRLGHLGVHRLVGVGGVEQHRAQLSGVLADSAEGVLPLLGEAAQGLGQPGVTGGRGREGGKSPGEPGDVVVDGGQLAAELTQLGGIDGEAGHDGSSASEATTLSASQGTKAYGTGTMRD